MSNYNFQNIQHNLPRMIRNQTYSIHTVQLVQYTVPGASFIGTSYLTCNAHCFQTSE